MKIVGLATAYSARARGHEAPFWNPANLGLSRNPDWSVGLNASAYFSNNALGYGQITDLYGLLYRPSNFDESRSYPVLNYLYPGPQSGSVGSRSFRASRGDKQALAELGFIVVEVD